jgi:hypothetical protein
MKKIILLTSTLFVYACGGGGGGGGDNDDEPQVILLETSVIRDYQKGDELTATLTSREISSGAEVSGDITITFGQIVQNPFLIDCKSVVYSGTLTSPVGPILYAFESLIYQDADHSIYSCGRFDNALGGYVFLTDTATSPNGIYLGRKSPVQLGDSTSGIVYLDVDKSNSISNGDPWEDCTSTVVAKENISTPLGLYESYKTNDSCSFSDGTTLVGSNWVVPSIFNLKELGTADGIEVELVINSYSWE